MIKVLITEDEKIESEALKILLTNNFENNMEVIAQASTGLESIKYCQLYRPDLVLMDIQMPEMNGLEAAERIKEQFPDTEIIIITAYSSFHYAQTAIKLGVTDYLIKPYSIKSLREVITNIEKKIEAKMVNKKHLGKLGTKVQSLVRTLEKELLIKIIREKSMERTVFKEYLKHLEIDKNYYYCAILRFDHYITVETESKIEKYLKSLNSRVLYITIFDRLVAFAFNDAFKEISTDMEMMTTFLTDDVTNDSGLNSYLLSPMQLDLKNMHGVYRQTLQLLDKEQQIQTQNINTNKLEKELCDSILAKDSSAAIAQVRNLIILVNRQYDRDLNSVKNYLRELNGFMLRIINKFVDEKEEHNFFANFVFNLFDCTDINQIIEYMVRYIGEIIVHLEAIYKEKKNNLIQVAKLHINNNYMNEISLDDLATVIGLSKSYLSRLFKRTELVNFKDYLTNVRMEKARELLMKGELSVAEIAYAVGFSEPNYFSKAFKKYTGLTPKDLRQ